MRYLCAMLAALCFHDTAALAQQSAHTHGVGTLLIAVEEGRVEIELVLSGADTVGFEHEPATEADKQAVRHAADTLADAARLFAFAKNAGCEIETIGIESDLLDMDDDQHKHDHGDADHAEFQARYAALCSKPDALSHLDVLVFQHFPATAALDAQAITLDGQTRVRLTEISNRLIF